MAALLAGSTVASPLPAAPNLGYRSPNQVPAAWVRYAELLQYRFKSWLSADDDVAYRFHLFLENRVVNEPAPPDTLVLKVWVDTDGTVSRVEFPPLPDHQANEDLEALLIHGDVGEAPPPDMLQPVQMKVALKWPS